MTTKHAATKLRIVVLQDVIGTAKHNKAAPGPAKPRKDRLALGVRYCATPEIGASGAFEASLTAGTMTYFTTNRAV
jgi:hypothetical protein